MSSIPVCSARITMHQLLVYLTLAGALFVCSNGETSSDVYNHLKAIKPTQPFQPIVRSLGCASAHLVDGNSTFFVLYGACFAGQQPVATWLYSVGPNTWFRNEPMFTETAGPGERRDHAVGTIPDETGVLLFGGQYEGNSSIAGVLYNDTWLFSAKTLEWAAVQLLSTVPPPRHSTSLVGCTVSHGCTTSGGVFMFGGMGKPEVDGGPPEMLDDFWRVDVDKHSNTADWQEIQTNPDPVSGLPSARGRHQVAVGNFTMYMSGGVVYNTSGVITFLVDLWELNLHNYTWSRLPDISVDSGPGETCSVAGLSYVPRERAVSPTLIALLSCSGDSEMRVWSYTIQTKHWESVWYIKGDSLPPPFVQPIAQEHAEQVYIYGGIDSQSRVYTGLWVLRYNTGDSTCVQAAAPDILPPIVSQHAAAYLQGTQALYVYGGVYPTRPALSGIEPRIVNVADTRLHVYNTSESMWTSIVRSGIPRLAGHSMVATGRELLIFGGFDTVGVSQASLYKFDIPSLVWSTLPMTLFPYKARHAHAVAMDNANNLMYVYGGLYSEFNRPVEVLGDLLVYNITTNTWHRMPIIGPKAPAVFGHSMALVNNCLYIFGGAALNTSGDLVTVYAVNDMIWRYDLVKHTWENLCYWVTPELYHPLLAGRFFTTASAKDLSVLMFVGDCCKAVCYINTKDLVPGVALNSHDVAKKCCSNSAENAAQPRVWLLSTNDETWMEMKMTYSTSAHKSPIRHAGHSLTNVEDRFLVHGGLCRAEDDNTLCSLALPTYSVWPGCNAGWYSPHVYDTACQPCPVTNFTTGPGSTQCEACLMQSYAASNGSTSQLQCTQCPREMCNNAGDCSVDSVSGTMQCDCDFGYAGDYYCRVPSVFLGMGGAALFIVILLLITCLLVHKYRNKRREDEEKERQLRTCKREISNLNSVWRIAPEELKLTQRIDGDTPGSFGEVYLAVYRDMQVAVKKLRTQVLAADTQALLEFQREAEFMRTIRHPNIVLFLGGGIMVDTSDKNAQIPFLVVELMSRGTLLSVLKDQTVHIDHQQRLRMALDIAKGMRFLHGLTPPRIHRDLKSANLLVSEHFVVKVSDFGSARWIQSIEECQQVSSSSGFSRSGSSVASTPINAKLVGGDVVTSIEEDDPSAPLISQRCPEALMSSDVGTLLWSAPEVLAQKAYGAAADVFSCGIVLWELYSRKEPYEHTSFRFSFEFAKYIVENGRPELDRACPGDYSALIQQCWLASPEKRPRFTDIVPNLDNQLERCFSPS